MFGFGMPELIIILVIMLVAFGPAKLPQLGSALGGAIRNFKKGSEEPVALSGNGKPENEKEPSSL
ncbi:twin-arginine translocase TatA/TatE family subunit [Geotalea toluenoxydans]